jgi:hypothetical protein
MSEEQVQQAHYLRRNSWLVAALAVLFLFVWWLPTPPALRGIAHFLPMHMAMETFAIVVAMLIFGITWNAYRQERAGNAVLLACAMLAVGLIDFAHMLSYRGMPDFVTPGGPEKAINFWLAARLLAALALLGMATLPRFSVSSPRAYRGLIAAALLLTALVYWLGLFHAESLPATFIEGRGLTPFKIAVEWLVHRPVDGFRRALLPPGAGGGGARRGQPVRRRGGVHPQRTVLHAVQGHG